MKIQNYIGAEQKKTGLVCGKTDTEGQHKNNSQNHICQTINSSLK
jgi:hypothetical protein